MDFAFSEEQELFRKTVRQFADRELRPHSAEWERPEFRVEDLMRKMGEVELLGLRLPFELGGADASFVTFGIAIEEVGRGDVSSADLLLIANVTSQMIAHYAPQSVKDEWLSDLVTGRRRAAFAISEPHCGSDAAALTTKAVRDGDDWLITGEKSSISAIGSDAYVVFARTTPGSGSRGVSLFLVPASSPGFAVQRFNDLGMRALQRGALHMDSVRVPGRYLLGEEGQAFYIAMNEFDFTRIMLGLMCLGAAQQTVDETVEFVKTRTAFGQPIGRFQGVAFPIAEAVTNIEAAQMLCYRALWLRDNGLPHTKEASMAKWFSTKASFDAIHEMLMLHGHAGYADDYLHGQRMRDVAGLEIADGTYQIMKMVIAREVLGRDFRPR